MAQQAIWVSLGIHECAVGMHVSTVGRTYWHSDIDTSGMWACCRLPEKIMQHVGYVRSVTVLPRNIEDGYFHAVAA